MKKTLIALAIASMAATSANAVTLYEQEGTKVDLDGSVRLWLGKDGGDFEDHGHGKFKQDRRVDLLNENSRINLKVSHKLNDNVKAFAGWELRFDGSEVSGAQAGGTDDTIKDKYYDRVFGGVATRQLYVGFDFADIGRLSFGRQTITADDVLQDDLYFRSGRINPLTVRGDKTIKFRSADWNGFSFGVDYLFGHANKESNKNGRLYKNGYGASLFYHYDFAENHKIEAALAYTVDQYDEANNTKVITKNHNWVLAVHYTLDDLKLGAAYGQRRFGFTQKVDGANSHNGYYFLQAQYDLQNLTGIPSTVAVQWERYHKRYDALDLFLASSKPQYKEINTQLITQIDYKFTPNVVPYVQFARASYKHDEYITSENIYGVGLRVYF